MKLEVDIPEDLSNKMQKFEGVDWEQLIVREVNEAVKSFKCLRKLKSLWGIN